MIFHLFTFPKNSHHVSIFLKEKLFKLSMENITCIKLDCSDILCNSECNNYFDIYKRFIYISTSDDHSVLILPFLVSQRKEYVKYAKVFPLSGTFDFKVPSKWYRRVVGSLEIICGLAMAIIPSRRCKESTTPFFRS